MTIPNHISRALQAAVAISLVVFCIGRDIQLEKQYTGDLRNRIVGARLQKDGRLPYFYKWNTGDGIRYYDPQNFDTLAVSNITATPFLHQLLYPVADLPQRKVSHLWLWITYILLFLAVLPVYFLAKRPLQQWAVVIAGGLLLLTTGWKAHIAAGQYYLAIPALCVWIFVLLRLKKDVSLLAAGMLSASLILVRPNALLLFIPLLWLFRSYSYRLNLFFITGMLLPAVFALAGPGKIAYWQQFRQALSEQVRVHQDLRPTIRNNAPDPVYTQWEGWDKQEVAAAAAQHPFHFEPEHGNLFLVYRHLFHRNLPLWVLSLLPLSFIAVSFIPACRKKNTGPVVSPALWLLGYCGYMLSDICSPFYRFQYNAVQWLFPLLLVALYANRRPLWLYAGLIVGLLLNIIEIHPVPFEHTVGEYLILLILMIAAFRWLRHRPV